MHLQFHNLQRFVYLSQQRRSFVSCRQNFNYYPATASSQSRTGEVKTSSIIPRAKQTLTVSLPNNNHTSYTFYMLHCKYHSLTERQMCRARNANIFAWCGNAVQNFSRTQKCAFNCKTREFVGLPFAKEQMLCKLHHQIAVHQLAMAREMIGVSIVLAEGCLLPYPALLACKSKMIHRGT